MLAFTPTQVLDRLDRKARVPLLGLALVSCVLTATSAEAAGLYTADRGVRPLGRGGAFVAGADDLGAIWYNPAGLADAGTTLFIDLAWMNFSSEFKRKAQVTDASGTVPDVSVPTRVRSRGGRGGG